MGQQAIKHAMDARLLKDEILRAQEMWRIMERKRNACTAMERYRWVKEILSCSEPWKTLELARLEAAFAECLAAGIDPETLREYKRIVDQERERRRSREELERAALMKSEKKLRTAVQRGRKAELLREEIETAEAAWYARTHAI